MPACSVIPVLAYPDVPAAVDWLCRAFGFELRLRIGAHRAQLAHGDGALVVAARAADAPAPAGMSVMLRVADADVHCARSRAHGAVIVAAPADFPYGERQYSALDPAGHAWTFSQTLADVDPASWGGEPGAAR